MTPIKTAKTTLTNKKLSKRKGEIIVTNDTKN